MSFDRLLIAGKNFYKDASDGLVKLFYTHLFCSDVERNLSLSIAAIIVGCHSLSWQRLVI